MNDTLSVAFLVGADAATASIFGAPVEPVLYAAGWLCIGLAIRFFAAAVAMEILVLADAMGRIGCPMHVTVSTSDPNCPS
jgi:hypothetical protein